MPETVLYLVRHGHYDHQMGESLTEIGREQSLSTAKWLRSLKVSAIHCSTLKRALETAEIISKEFPGVVGRPTNLLCELPNLLWEAPDRRTGFEYLTAKQLEECKNGAEEAFAKFCRRSVQEACVEVLVSHGNLIRYFVCRALGIAPESWWNLGTYNCGISEIRITKEGTVRLFTYNNTGHLPDRLRSEGVVARGFC